MTLLTWDIVSKCKCELCEHYHDDQSDLYCDIDKNCPNIPDPKCYHCKYCEYYYTCEKEYQDYFI